MQNGTSRSYHFFTTQVKIKNITIHIIKNIILYVIVKYEEWRYFYEKSFNFSFNDSNTVTYYWI